MKAICVKTTIGRVIFSWANWGSISNEPLLLTRSLTMLCQVIIWKKHGIRGRDTQNSRKSSRDRFVTSRLLYLWSVMILWISSSSLHFCRNTYVAHTPMYDVIKEIHNRSHMGSFWWEAKNNMFFGFFPSGPFRPTMGSFLIIIVVIDHKNATFGIPFSFSEFDSPTSIILFSCIWVL